MPLYPPASGGGVTIQDEGVAQGSASILNFTGATVSATVAAGTATVNVTAGGGGTPGGNANEVQYNNGAGAFAGAANVEVSAAGNLNLVATTDPVAPAAGTATVYSKDIGGRIMPKWIGPAGVDTPFQAFLGMNHIRLVQPGTATAATTVVNAWGTAFTALATTYAQTTPVTGSLRSRTRLSTLTGTTTAGTMTYVRGNFLECARETGFFFVNRFGLNGTLQVGHRAFFGLWGAAANPTNVDPLAAATTYRLGMAVNANSGNWFIVQGTGAAVTTTDLGASFAQNATDLLELVLFCAPGGASISYRVTNMTSGVQATGTLSTNIPTATQYMTFSNWITNNATAAASAFAFKSVYIETDY